MENLAEVERAVAEGKLLESSGANIRRTLESKTSPIAAQSISELIEAGEWTELNDRFYRELAFGTGGIRGRTIGRIVTRAEEGTPNDLGAPLGPRAHHLARAPHHLRPTHSLYRRTGERPLLLLAP